MTTYNTSDRYALRALLGTNVGSDIDLGFLSLRDDVSAKLTPYSAGLLASRPVSTVGTPGIAGRTYLATDVGTGTEYVDTGTAWVALNPQDAAAGVASMRTLGVGAAQAAAGNDSRLSDARNPIALSVSNASVNASAAIAYSKLNLAASILGTDVSATAAIAESKLALATDAAVGVGSRRTLGTGALQAAVGLTAIRTNSGAATAIHKGSVTTAGSFTTPGESGNSATAVSTGVVDVTFAGLFTATPNIFLNVRGVAAGLANISNETFSAGLYSVRITVTAAGVATAAVVEYLLIGPA